VTVNLDICKAPLKNYSIFQSGQIWQNSFTCKQAIPAFTAQP